MTQFTWFDRSGKRSARLASRTRIASCSRRCRPDGRRVVAYRTSQNNTDIWLFDAGRGRLR